ncbi:MAG: hypothetical protein AB1696_19080 [Planctomycetota bacterium]
MKRIILCLLLSCVFVESASPILAQDGGYYTNRKYLGQTPTPFGWGTVVSEEYYVPVYVDPVVRYRYPAWQAVGDGEHTKRIGEAGWRLMKAGNQIYVFGPGSYWGNPMPFAYGPGGVVIAARGRTHSTIPIAGSLFTFFFDLALRF